MKNKQRFVTASVTVVAAVAAAHFMQRGSDQNSRMAAVAPATASIMPDAAAPRTSLNAVVAAAKPDPALLAAVAGLASAAAPAEPVRLASAEPTMAGDAAPSATALGFPEMPRIPAEALMPSPLPANGSDLRMRMAAVSTDLPQPAKAEPEAARNQQGLRCGAILSVSVKEAAMVGLTLTDPCRGNEAFTLEHGPLRYRAAMDQLGSYTAEVPALAAEARYSVRFADGTSVDAVVAAPRADEIDRALLFSDGRAGLQIHALEFGADYDQPGHVWSGNPRSAQAAVRAGGGFVTVLGDAGLQDARIAEIYTFPPEVRDREGVVRLSIEAEVTALNCGRDVAGQTLQKDGAAIPAPVTITLAMPDCDAIGEFLVLKNLLRDLKIASN